VIPTLEPVSRLVSPCHRYIHPAGQLLPCPVLGARAARHPPPEIEHGPPAEEVTCTWASQGVVAGPLGRIPFFPVGPTTPLPEHQVPVTSGGSGVLSAILEGASHIPLLLPAIGNDTSAYSSARGPRSVPSVSVPPGCSGASSLHTPRPPARRLLTLH
jgi:hypothetical protein